MKRLLWVFVWLLTLNRSNAQTKNTTGTQTFDISIIPGQVQIAAKESNGTVTITSSDPKLNNLLRKYTIKAFFRPYATSNQIELRNTWRVKTTDANLMNDLLAYSRLYFPEAHPVPEARSLYIPNDYVQSGGPNYAYLSYMDMINAPQAWDITHGDASVIMGITEVGGVTTGHPDLAGKFATVRPSNGSGNGSHGIAVAGMMAANTDNGFGVTGIGFNNRLDVGGGLGYDELLMAQDGVRVINASWTDGASVNLPANLSNSYWNEIYENGTSMVVAAGNGYNSCFISPYSVGNQAYQYPAAYDHNLSITSVGHVFDTGTYNLGTNVCGVTGVSGGYSWKDVVEYRVNWQDCASEFTTNDKVDLCAPGGMYGFTTTYNGTFNYNTVVGTSFSAPLVAGTIGLMLAANKYLSPYQVEHILKATASQNMFSIWPNTRPIYQGKLGAGRLDAGAAVTMAKTYPVNTPETQSLFISGIQISSLCDPATLSANGFNMPVLFPHIENYFGYPGVEMANNTSMTYLWEDIAGNGAVLSCTNCLNPQVVSVDPNNKNLWYNLTVYDNGFAGQPVKVAHKKILVTLNSNPGHNIVISDSYADNFSESSAANQVFVDQRDAATWKDNDIWSSSSTQYNDVTGQGATMNRIPAPADQVNNTGTNANIIIRNIGCDSYGDTTLSVKLYGAIANTGHSRNDWQLLDTKSIIPGGSLNPGAYIIRGFTNIALDATDLQYANDCIITGQENRNIALQAKIVTTGTEQVPGYTEDNITARNIRNSAKIAVNDYISIRQPDPAAQTPLIIPFLIENNTGKTQAFNVKISSLRSRFKYLAGKCRYRARLEMCANMLSTAPQVSYTNITIEPDGTLNLGDMSLAAVNNLVLYTGRSYFCRLILDMPSSADPVAGTNGAFDFDIAQYISDTQEQVGNISVHLESNN